MSNRIKIGIIDSGVDRRFVKECGINILAAASFDLDKKNKQLEINEYNQDDIKEWLNGTIDHITDENGHGTAVLSIIWKNYQNADYIIVKVLDYKLRGNSIILVEALDWLINFVKPNVINLSLGTIDAGVKNKLWYLCEKAKENEIKVFCAASSVISYPASFKNVITVGDYNIIDYIDNVYILHTIDIYCFCHNINLYEESHWIEKKISTSYACAYALFT